MIDLVNPVNWNCPLNTGRVFWGICLPGLVGGLQFRDIAGGNNGALTNMYTPAGGWGANSGWQGTTRPGGWGALQFDGVDDYVSTSLTIVPPITVSAWVRFSAVGSSSQIFYGQWDNPGNKWLVYWWPYNRISFFAGQDTYFAVTPTSGIWYHICHTVDASGNITGYLNGVPQPMTGNPQRWIASNNTFQVGKWSGFDFAGTQDDISIWSRALSAAEVFEEYNLSLQGYPGVLNRVPAWMMGSGAGSIYVPYHYLYNQPSGVF